MTPKHEQDRPRQGPGAGTMGDNGGDGGNGGKGQQEELEKHKMPELDRQKVLDEIKRQQEQKQQQRR